jgi:hypothetical protein
MSLSRGMSVCPAKTSQRANPSASRVAKWQSARHFLRCVSLVFLVADVENCNKSYGSRLTRSLSNNPQLRRGERDMCVVKSALQGGYPRIP